MQIYRTSEELTSFVRKFMNAKSSDTFGSYPSVAIMHAGGQLEAIRLVRSYERMGYAFINFTPSRYGETSFDGYAAEHNTHSVIGYEFDGVVLVLDRTFFYDEKGMLTAAHPHPCRKYMYVPFAYQAVTRARERLAIVVVDNLPLYKVLLGIQGGME